MCQEHAALLEDQALSSTAAAASRDSDRARWQNWMLAWRLSVLSSRTPASTGYLRANLHYFLKTLKDAVQTQEARLQVDSVGERALRLALRAQRVGFAACCYAKIMLLFLKRRSRLQAVNAQDFSEDAREMREDITSQHPDAVVTEAVVSLLSGASPGCEGAHRDERGFDVAVAAGAWPGPAHF